jgi:hypothetical protein
MPEPTREAQAARFAALEEAAELKNSPRKRAWRRVVGNSEDYEFTRLVVSEIEASREAQRRAAREESPV